MTKVFFSMAGIGSLRPPLVAAFKRIKQEFSAPSARTSKGKQSLRFVCGWPKAAISCVA
jgi:hypothetical protein